MKKLYKDVLVPKTVHKVVTDNSLKRKYKDHPSRLGLVKSFDIFLVSDSLVATLPHLLGKHINLPCKRGLLSPWIVCINDRKTIFHEVVSEKGCDLDNCCRTT